MTPVPVPSAARAHGAAPRSRIAALLAALALAACGGGTTPGGAWFVQPLEVLQLPMGASFDFELNALLPKTTVGLVLDGDADAATVRDMYPLAGTFVAGDGGGIVGRVSTDGVPPGEHRLLALDTATGKMLARADNRVILVTRGRIDWFSGASDEIPRFAQPLPNGRVALAGQITGATASGPSTGQAAVIEDAFTAVLDGGNLLGVRTISGADEQRLSDLAVSPTGLFSVAGTALGRPTLGPVQSTPPTALDADRAGFLATYTGDGNYATGMLTWGFFMPDLPSADVQATAVTHAADGARWLALRFNSNFYVGGDPVAPPGPDGGAIVVRITNQNRADAPLVTLRGIAEIHALRFDAQGHLFVAGTAEGQVRFGTAALPLDVFTGGAFVARYDAAGTCLGVLTRTTGTGNTTADDLALGADGRLFVVGRAQGASTFGDVTVAAALGGADGYVLALTSDLVPTWAHTWNWVREPGSTEFAEARCSGVVALPDGGCAVVGSTEHQADVGTVRIGDELPGRGDGALGRYDSAGQLEWVVRIGGAETQRVEGLAVDAHGCFLIPGATIGTLELTDRDGLNLRVPPYLVSFDGFLLTLDPDGRVR